MKTIAYLLVLFFLTNLWFLKKFDFHFSNTNDGAYETVMCQVGDVIVVHLPENQSMGFQWIIPEEREHFNSIWSMKDNKFIHAHDTSDNLETGGMRYFEIKWN